MNREEFRILASALKTYYPKEQLLSNQQALELWHRELCDIPYKVAEAALRKWVSISKWSPTIADIREQAMNVQAGEIPLWSDGWDECCKMIRKYGSYGADKAMAELTGITKETVKRLGFRELCISENPMADRANFRMIFEQLAQRKQKTIQLPESLLQQIYEFQEERIEHDGERILAANREIRHLDTKQVDRSD